MSDIGVFERYDPATGTTTIFVPRPAAAPLAAPVPAAPLAPVPGEPAAPVAPAPADGSSAALPVAGVARIETVVHRHYVELPDGQLLAILPPGAQPLGAYGNSNVVVRNLLHKLSSLQKPDATSELIGRKAGNPQPLMGPLIVVETKGLEQNA